MLKVLKKNYFGFFLFATDFTWQIFAKKILMVLKLCFFVNVKLDVFFLYFDFLLIIWIKVKFL